MSFLVQIGDFMLFYLNYKKKNEFPLVLGRAPPISAHGRSRPGLPPPRSRSRARTPAVPTALEPRPPRGGRTPVTPAGWRPVAPTAPLSQPRRAPSSPSTAFLLLLLLSPEQAAAQQQLRAPPQSFVSDVRLHRRLVLRFLPPSAPHCSAPSRARACGTPSAEVRPNWAFSLPPSPLPPRSARHSWHLSALPFFPLCSKSCSLWPRKPCAHLVALCRG
jgi:hypothetical protein